MVKHIILWQLKEMADEEKAVVKDGIKNGLESLYGRIDGLEEIRVYTQGLSSSNADVMLYSVFTDAKALAAYATHPDHVYAADTFVRPFTAVRLCLDFEE